MSPPKIFGVVAGSAAGSRECIAGANLAANDMQNFLSQRGTGSDA
jgi:hypothetical protein